jgi:hypothetical protein
VIAGVIAHMQNYEQVVECLLVNGILAVYMRQLNLGIFAMYMRQGHIDPLG